MSKHFPPKYQSDQFHCPYCNVYASQNWTDALVRAGGYQPRQLEVDRKKVELSICAHCNRPSFWLSKEMIYPPTQTFPSANEDLDDDIKKIYDEAAAIASQSPRAACALLRLALQMLLSKHGGSGDINSDIRKLVKQGLSVTIQQSLDIVRVTGNSAVHPGKIDFDDITDVRTLFDLINAIANSLITLPQQVQNIYNNIPEEKRKAIEEQDGESE